VTDWANVVLVFIPFQLESKALTKINKLADYIADDHEPHEFKRLIEIDFRWCFHLDEFFLRLIF